MWNVLGGLSIRMTSRYWLPYYTWPDLQAGQRAVICRAKKVLHVFAQILQISMHSSCSKKARSPVGGGNYTICNYLWLCINWIKLNALKTLIYYFLLVGAMQASVVSGIAPFVLMGKWYIFRNISYIFKLHFRFKLNILKIIYKYYLCKPICVKKVQSSRPLLLLKWSVNFPYI
jgi:hypothetical protein